LGGITSVRERKVSVEATIAAVSVSVSRMTRCAEAEMAKRRETALGLVPKIFQDSPSHRILRHMHEVLNIDENKN